MIMVIVKLKGITNNMAQDYKESTNSVNVFDDRIHTNSQSSFSAGYL
jgi:hypothetical protein